MQMVDNNTALTALQTGWFVSLFVSSFIDVHFPDSLRRTDPQLAVRRHPPGKRPPVLRQACRVAVLRGHVSVYL